MAEGLLRAELQRLGLQDKVWVDSAGTHAAQLGRAPDPRAQQLLRLEGIDIRRCRARQVREEDFERFQYILAMDSDNYHWLMKKCPEHNRDRIHRIGSWIGVAQPVDIPDPHYGNVQGFQFVLAQLREAVGTFLRDVDLGSAG
jgi:protein-tyrosine phosphatase